MTDIRWARMALVDLDAIDTYHRRIDRRLADRIGTQIIAAAAFLGEVPRSGPLDQGDRRRWRVGGTPYSLFYRVMPDHVSILRVRHGARRPFAS
ncbi:MAG TPA: type II toxin-antitoxin system RelE/ParE family toxin [Sphingomonas sp.]